jgi:hypothetical protein
MKIISHILTLFLSGMKSEDIYLELILIILALKAEWVVLAAFFSNAVKTFACRYQQPNSYRTGHLSLCPQIY